MSLPHGAQVEPPPKWSSLYTLDNVVLTPHIGWKRLETRQALLLAPKPYLVTPQSYLVTPQPDLVTPKFYLVTPKSSRNRSEGPTRHSSVLALVTPKDRLVTRKS